MVTGTRKVLSVLPLAQAAFSPFGDVIETEGVEADTINDGFAERFHDLTRIDVSSGGGRPLLNIFQARPRSFPMEIEFLERHPLGSQAFVPLSRLPFLVLVAEEPEIGFLRLFRSNGRQGINYRRGVWHYPLLVPYQTCEFVVIDRGGPGDDCEVCRLDQSAWIDSDSGWQRIE